MTKHVGNLPAEVSSFVDRREERVEIKRLLSISRLVTVTGVGGVGKTRTAMRVAAEVRKQFPGGVWFVELGALRAGELLAEVVAEGLGLRDQTSRTPEVVLAEYLAEQRLLLVLDGCEHLVDLCAVLVRTLLRAAPELRVLVTSRHALCVTGEHLFPLAPLAVPPAGEWEYEPGAYAGVELFLERAQAVERRFTLTEANRAAVGQLCRRLDGIPLAIELAAGRLRALSVQDIEAHLDDRFGLLSGRSRVWPARHETLRAAIDWSYELCSPGERLLWARMSVFPADFDLTAVREVCTDDELPAREVLDLVAGLVDKSVLLREDHALGARYRMLDTLREYGKARSSAEHRGRHRDHFLAMALRCAAQWCGPDQIAWYERIMAEQANMRAALEFCFADPGEREAALTLAAALAPVWLACGSLREGRHHLDRAVALPGPPSPALARARTMCAWLATIQGDLDAVDGLLEQCQPYAEEHRDTELTAWVAYVAGTAAAFRGDMAAALTRCREAEELHRTGGELAFGRLAALGSQCFAYALANEFEQAIPLIERLCELCERSGEQWIRSYADYIRAIAELGRGDLAAAVTHARDALRRKQRLGDSVGIVRLFELLAIAGMARGDAERAVRLLGAAEELWPTVGAPRFGSPDLAKSHQQCAEQAADRLGEQAYEAALKAGADLTLTAAIAYALDEQRPESARQPAAWAPLTRREREIAEYVAQGLTNQEIANRLVISKRTAESHIQHTFTKLGLTNRFQLATWVTEQDGSRS